MLTRNQDADLYFGIVQVKFVNTPHLEDCLAHARQHNIEARLILALWTVAMKFSPHARGGDEVILSFIPTSRVQPTFAWHARLGGRFGEEGFIDYNESSRVWIHRA